MAEAITLRDVEDRRAQIHSGAVVSSRAVVGAPAEHRSMPTLFDAVIADGVTIRECVRVHAGVKNPTYIGAGTLLMAGSHVGHDSVLGEDCEVAPNAVIGGHCTLGARVRVGMGATLVPYRTVGDGARIGAGAVVTKDIPAGETWVGNPARRLQAWKGES